ncbi:AraC family transcriptional regulator [Streptomyces sp. AC536]|uniref:AraC family transcriptional regulator n=1 Tax=Streptomyces buecherae TaxID=2763006 RepID=UPI00164D751C|nr:AraC family transcriptional regulator [Streptomyces buecherae]MBC3987212.1 AraC family transcriptional regulator [Streptomyces buecherae]QNJ43553.1 AraC family transcriptional regulator [Streptomyces buecherae]
MDPIDDVLAARSVEDSRYVSVEARGAWGISFRSPHTTYVMMIRSGRCWWQPGSQAEPELLAPGNCFLVRAGAEFALADEPGRSLVSCESLLASQPGSRVRHGTEGPVTEIVSARLAFDTGAAEPLLRVLPPVLRLDLDDSIGDALRSTFRLLELERTSSGFGSGFITSRLADALFVYALRTHVSSTESSHGWLSALSDPRLAPALRDLHTDLAHPWTVEELARRAGMSRAAFAVAFRQKTGDSPINYLTYWRMHRAKALLRDTESSLQQIALAIGYDTDAAFSRAFRRHESVAPGAWRRRWRASAGDSGERAE